MRSPWDIAKGNRRRLDSAKASLDPKSIARYIDDGLPLMWGVYADSDLYMDVINTRTRDRKQVTDWEAWQERLEAVRKAVRKMDDLQSGGHACMIIGYNEETEEIATSDSWGPEFEERWMTVEEAEAISQGTMQILKW